MRAEFFNIERRLLDFDTIGVLPRKAVVAEFSAPRLGNVYPGVGF